MMELKNNGPVFLRLANTDVGSSARWVFSHDASGNLGINRDGSTNEFYMDSAGNLTLTGTITTTGTTCNTGCDLVFDESFDLMPIGERAELMWANGYLPNVGPTVENAPFNLTDKVGRMLNELEHAHIYIAQLHERLERLESAAGEID